MAKRGDIVMCVENGGDSQAYGVTVGKTYVVSNIERHRGTDYLMVLGDDLRGHPLLASMFKPAPLTAAKG